MQDKTNTSEIVALAIENTKLKRFLKDAVMYLIKGNDFETVKDIELPLALGLRDLIRKKNSERAALQSENATLKESIRKLQEQLAEK